jgi:hypothetical protein
MDWAAPRGRGDRLATKPDLVLNYLVLLWRRRESNAGPAMSQESAGASRRAVSVEKSVVCGAEGETASALESGGESCWCSNVASGPPPAELLELVDGAVTALDAIDSEIARTRLQALAEAVRSWLTRKSGEFIIVP